MMDRVLVKDYDYGPSFGKPEHLNNYPLEVKRCMRKVKLPSANYLRSILKIEEPWGLVWIKDNSIPLLSTPLITIDGRRYAKWRIMSMIMLGTPNGRHPNYLDDKATAESIQDAEEAELLESRREQEFKRLYSHGELTFVPTGRESDRARKRVFDLYNRVRKRHEHTNAK